MIHYESNNWNDQWVRSYTTPDLWSHPTGYWYFDKSQLMAYYVNDAKQWRMYDHSKKQWYEYSADIFYSQNQFNSQIEPVAPGTPESRPSKKIQSADFVLHNDQTKTMFSGTLDVNESLIEGLLSSYDQKELLPATIHLPYPDILEIHPRPISKDDWGLVDPNGNWTNYRIEGYSVTESNGGANQVHKGTFVDPAGKRVRFEVTTDPVPPAVIIAGIGALTCITIIGIQAMTMNCTVNQSDSIKDCLAKGGLPNIHPVVTFGIRLDPFRLGCDYDCQFECKPKPLA